MKKSTGVPKKSPRKRHKKKRLKNRKRSLRQRLARLSTTQQALAAIRPATSGLPAAESEPERSLPTPARGRPLWEVTVNSVDAPQFFGLQQLPKISDLVTIRLPRPATPPTVDAVYRHSWALQPSSWGVVLSRTKPCEPPPELTTRPLRLPLAFLSPPLTIVMPHWPPSKPPPEQPPEQPRTQNEPSLPGLPPSGRSVRKVGSLKELTLAVVADNASREEQAPAGNRENSVPYEVVFIRHSRRMKQLRKTTEPFKKKSCFVKKFYRPDKNRLSRKSIGSSKRERLGLSGSHQPRRHAMKTPLLSRAAGKGLLIKPVKLLVPIIKQHSELFTPVAAAELRMRQPSSLSYSAIKMHLKPEKTAFITDNATREEQLPADDREDNVHYTLIVREPLPVTEPLRKYAALFSDKAYFVRKESRANKLIVRKQDEKAIDVSQHRLTELQSSKSSAADSEQMTPVSPAAEPMRQDPSVEHSPAEQPLNFIYPAVIADQLMNEALIFDQGAAKDHFRKFFGPRQTTSGSEWEFCEAESLFIRLSECLPELKQACLEEFGAVPGQLFCLVSAEVAQYVKLSLTEQDCVIRDLWHEFSEHMADFDRLIHSLAAAGPTASGVLEPPAGPPCEVVTTSLLLPHPARDHSFNNDG
ncbi:hypothetical protein [unidentified bacterial endosymbiont]|uniref:hypothetical protein n=1 Tax=unidentified bacterial endosymbiont TaxID=2355 RepID=UPI00209CAE4D|nr:hypothetical protein [unidentified bacterial endosymbiont]